MVAFVPGSIDFGIDAIETRADTLPTAYISIEFIDGNKVDECRDNQLDHASIGSYSNI
jgi:hypothetical protein